MTMSSEDMNLFKNYNWFGEFYPFSPEEKNKKIPGEIKFSFEDGIEFEGLFIDSDLQENSNVLCGILNSGDKCTLLGKYNVDKNSSEKNGRLFHSKKIIFEHLVIGEHLTKDTKISSLKFTLTNLEEFFFLKDWLHKPEFLEKFPYKIETRFGEMEIQMQEKVNTIPNNITSILHIQNKKAQEELQFAYEQIKEKYPQVSFEVRKDVTCFINLNFLKECNLYQAFEAITHSSNLFALLLHKPVFPKSIFLKIGDKKAKLYPSLFLHKRTIKFSKEKQHYPLPINISNITLSSIISNWFENADQYSLFITNIQFNTGYKRAYNIRADIVLYITILDFISKRKRERERVKEKEKYKYPLSEYCCPKFQIRLAQKLNPKILGKKSSKILANYLGKSISDLRNEILHPKREKTILQKLKIYDLYLISKYLQMTIIGYVLTTLGVEKNLIQKYQESFFYEEKTKKQKEEERELLILHFPKQDKIQAEKKNN